MNIAEMDSLKKDIWRAFCRFFYVLVILLLSSLPFLKWGFRGIIDHADMRFPLCPLEFVFRMNYAWDEYAPHFGLFSFAHITSQPIYLLPALLSLLGSPMELVNRATLVILFTLVGLSMYSSMRLLTPNMHQASGIVAAIFYMYNPYMVGQLWLGSWIRLYVIAIFPLFLSALIKGLEDKSHWLAWAMLIGLSSYFVVTNLRLLTIAYGILALYLLIFILTNNSKDRLMRCLKLLLISSSISVLVNSFWILPALGNFASISSLMSELYESTIQVRFPPTFSNLTNISRLIGYGIPVWEDYGAFFETTLATLVGLVIVIYAYSAIIVDRRSLITCFFLLIAALLTLHQILFVHFPLYRSSYIISSTFVPSPLNYLLFSRELAYLSMPVALSYAFLIGRTTQGILNETEGTFSLDIRLLNFSIHVNRQSRKKIFSKFLGVLLSMAVLFNSLPLITLPRDDPLAPIPMPPTYYEEAKSWLSTQDRDFRLFVIPDTKSLWYERFTWVEDDRVVTDVLQDFVPVPLIRSVPGGGFALGDKIVQLAYECESVESMVKILQILGVRYILVRNDTKTETARIADLHESISSHLDIERTFGALHFYRTSYSTTVYATTLGFVVWGGIDHLPSLANFGRIVGSPALFFAAEVQRESLISIIRATGRIIIPADELRRDPDLLSFVIKEVSPSVAYLIGPEPLRSFDWLEKGLYASLTAFSTGIMSNVTYFEWNGCNESFPESGSLDSAISLLIPVKSVSDDPFEHFFKEDTIIRLNSSKINPTKYVLTAEFEKPFFLVLNQGYDPGWKAYVSGQELKHFLVNSYGNAFYVDSTSVVEIEMTFEPQKLYEIGRWISIATSILGLCTFAHMYLRVFKEQHKK